MLTHVPLCTAITGVQRKAQAPAGPPQPLWKRVKLRDPHEPVTNPLPQGESPTSDEDLRIPAALIPGEGSLTDRVTAFKSHYVIPKDRLQVVMDAAIAE